MKRTTRILMVLAAASGEAPALAGDAVRVPASPSAEASPPSPPSAAAPSPPPTAAPAPAVPSSPAAVPPSPYGPPPPPYVPATASSEASTGPARDPGMRDPKRPEVLIDSLSDYSFGGFAGVSVMYTRLAGKNAAQVCGEAAVVVDHALTFGGGGCGVATKVEAYDYGEPPHDSSDRLLFGYGGAILRYHFEWRRLANYSVGMLIGAGSLTIGTWDGSDDGTDASYKHKSSEAVFVVEPQVSGYVNVTRWMRAGLTGGYRIASGVRTKNLSASDIGGPTLGAAFQLGWF